MHTNYDGVVGRIPADVANRMARLNVPMSNLTPYVESNHGEQISDLPGVYVDKEAVERIAVEHLAQCGYDRLATVVEHGAHAAPFIRRAMATCEAQHLHWLEPLFLPKDYMNDADKYAAMLKNLNWDQVRKIIILLI